MVKKHRKKAKLKIGQQSRAVRRKRRGKCEDKSTAKERLVGQWSTLNQAAVRGGIAIVAAAMGREVRPPRGYANAADLADRLTPYIAFAELTLMAGAFDYRKTSEPTKELVIGVMIDFLRAAGAADANDEMRLRSALLAPPNHEMAMALREKVRA